MSSGHDHEHPHAHGVSENADAKRLSTALALIAGFMAVEVVVGILAHSLALISDAAHRLTDAGALVMSLIVIRRMRRPSGGNLTFGLKRSEILSAQANGGTLLVLAALIVYEGVHRLITPPPAEGKAILIVALVGIVVNLAAAWELAKLTCSSIRATTQAADSGLLQIRGAASGLVLDGPDDADWYTMRLRSRICCEPTTVGDRLHRPFLAYPGRVSTDSAPRPE